MPVDKVADIWTYDRFTENTPIGECTVTPDARELALWHQVSGHDTAGPHDPSTSGLSERSGDGAGDGYGDGSTTGSPVGLPGGLLLALAMRGYLSVVQPRPPGNVHASSLLRWGVTAAHADEPLLVRVSCLSKHIARERRWVDLLVTVVDRDDALILSNQLKMVWAA